MAVGDVLSDLGKGVIGRSDYSVGLPDQLPYNKEIRGSYGNQQAARYQQGALNRTIAERAQGFGGPSVAELQMQRGNAQALQQAGNMAASGRGISRAASQTNAQNAQSNLAGQNIANTGMLRANEQIAAQQLAQQGYGQQRGQDIQAMTGMTEAGTGLLNARNQAANINAQMEQANAKNAQGPFGMLAGAAAGALALSDVRAKDVYSRGMSSDYDVKDAGLPDYNSFQNAPMLKVGKDSGIGSAEDETAKQLDALKSKEQKDRIDAISSKIGGGDMGGGFGEGAKQGFDIAAAAAMLSDYDLKSPNPGQSRRDLDTVIPTGYFYKPEAGARMASEAVATHPEASPRAQGVIARETYVGKVDKPTEGIVAQDLAKSPAFKDSVMIKDNRLAIDRDRALSKALYELGGLDKRLKQLEGNDGMSSDYDVKSSAPRNKTGWGEDVDRQMDDLESALKAKESKAKAAPAAHRGGGPTKPVSSGPAPGSVSAYTRRRLLGAPPADVKLPEKPPQVIAQAHVESDYNSKNVEDSFLPLHWSRANEGMSRGSADMQSRLYDLNFPEIPMLSDYGSKRAAKPVASKPIPYVPLERDIGAERAERDFSLGHEPYRPYLSKDRVARALDLEMAKARTPEQREDAIRRVHSQMKIGDETSHEPNATRTMSPEFFAPLVNSARGRTTPVYSEADLKRILQERTAI